MANLLIDDHAGSDLRVDTTGDSLYITINNGYVGDSGQVCSIDLTPAQAFQVALFILNTQTEREPS